VSIRRVLIGTVAIAASFASTVGSPTFVDAAHATTAPKAGDPCAPAQAGKKVGTLVCVKNGSLQRWEPAKGAPAKSSAPTGSPAPASTPTVGRASKDPVKLGIALGQSGSVTANLAQDQTLGVKLAEKYFNEKGGINGRPIKLVIQDTTSDEAGAVSVFNALINSEKVVGIVGPTLSLQAFAADPIAERAKVPVVAPSNTAAGIPQIGDYIARVSAPIANYAANAIKFALTQQPTGKAAVFFAQDDGFSRNETLVFQSALKDANVELLAPQTFNAADTDFTTQTAFVQSYKPDLVVISGLAPAGNLVRSLRESGFKGSIVGGNGLNVVQTFSFCRAACDGLIVNHVYSPVLPADGINLEFRKQFKLEHGRDPGQIAAQAFTSVQVFVEALSIIEKAGKLTDDLRATRSALNTQILASQYSTPLGEISFDKEGELVQKNFYVAQIRMQRGDSGDAFAGTFNYVKF
jgi:branched-chain amino acid transport system substrate-binding protein